MILDYFTKNRNYLILIFTVGYFITFLVNAFIQGNLEFIYYIFLLSGLIFVIVILNRVLHLAFFIIFNLSLMGFFHLLGGNLYLGATRLYDYYFIAGFLKYDNFVHVYGTFIATIILYNLISPIVADHIRKNYLLLAIGLVLMAIGIGALNELVEFLAVLFFNAAEQVGGYFNNSLDLLFNTLGAIIGSVVIYFYIERPKYFQQLKKLNEPGRKIN